MAGVARRRAEDGKSLSWGGRRRPGRGAAFGCAAPCAAQGACCPKARVPGAAGAGVARAGAAPGPRALAAPARNPGAACAGWGGGLCVQGGGVGPGRGQYSPRRACCAAGVARKLAAAGGSRGAPQARRTAPPHSRPTWPPSLAILRLVLRSTRGEGRQERTAATVWPPAPCRASLIHSAYAPVPSPATPACGRPAPPGPAWTPRAAATLACVSRRAHFGQPLLLLTCARSVLAPSRKGETAPRRRKPGGSVMSIGKQAGHRCAPAAAPHATRAPPAACGRRRQRRA